MAINKNHEFEELDGVKCCIVERAVTAERAAFLKYLLEGNGYTVVVSGLLPKAAPAPKEGEETAPLPPVEPTQFTVGVTDMTYNTINAIFGRQLRTSKGQVVTLAYWKQQETEAQEDVPYFEKE